MKSKFKIKKNHTKTIKCAKEHENKKNRKKNRKPKEN